VTPPLTNQAMKATF